MPKTKQGAKTQEVSYESGTNAAAITDTSGKNDGMHLGTVARIGVALPKIFMNVADGSCLRDAVDSCSNKSLISSAVASGLGCPMLPTDLGEIITIDVNPERIVEAVRAKRSYTYAGHAQLKLLPLLLSSDNI